MQKIKVLVVDDATFMRDIVKKSLRAAFPGFTVQEAANGRQAQSRLADGDFDLILCDWEMPEMAGDELLAWLRGEEKLASTPFIMVTSRGDKEHVVKAIEIGVNNYIVKPFTADKLAGVVTKTLVKAKGISAEQLRAIGNHGPRNSLGNDSAAILTGGKSASQGLSGAVPVAETLTSTSAPKPTAPAPRSVTPKQKVLGQIRFNDGAVACLIKQLDTDKLTAVVKRADRIPALLDMAAFDFAVGDEEEVSRINAYIHALEARDQSQESEFINVILRFVDDDPAKQAHLERYIASIAD